MSKSEKIRDILVSTGCRVVCVTGSLLFLFLSWYSLRFTQYMPPNAPEFPVDVRDSSIWNLLAFLFICGIMGGLTALDKRLSAGWKQVIMRGIMTLMLIWLTFAGFWWIYSAERVPAADQLYICMDAIGFMDGNFTSLRPEYYCGRYPQQLGMIAVLELIFSVAGAFQYFVLEIVNAVAVPCIAYFGYRIVREITEDMAVAVVYCLTMTGCLPLIFYTSWVYGEILSIFCSMLAVFLFLRYGNRKKWGYLAGALAALALAVVIRKNCLILAIAFCLVALLAAIRQKDRRLLIAAVCAMVIPGLAVTGVRKIYELRSGISVSGGLPTSSWIEVGLQEADGRYGWYCSSETDPYAESGYDTEKSNIVYMQGVRDRLQIFWEQPAYALHFFKQKQLSQWNQPLYQGYHFSQNYPEENPPAEDSFAYWLSEDAHFQPMLSFCDRLQFILYMGMLLFFLFAVRREGNLLAMVLPVMIIGGFFFSLIWEAKARYIFPYYVAMFPVAAVGYQKFLLWLKHWTGEREESVKSSGKKAQILRFPGRSGKD